MIFFRIIIPNYNNAGYIDRCIESVLNQTFSNWRLIIVDDGSTDDSYDKILSYTLEDERVLATCNADKRWNGGSRNVGMGYFKDSEYTLFLDSDDWLYDDDVLQNLHDFIESNDYPDCIRLPYHCVYDGDKTMDIMLDDSTPERLVESIFVACWTKCVKTSLLVQFPENTLMEDVVQHIRQCDVITTVEPFNKLAVVYNRNNPNSCSSERNQDLQHGKWQSSMFRYMADLLDLQLIHDYCTKHRDWRADICLKNIKDGKYAQSV